MAVRLFARFRNLAKEMTNNLPNRPPVLPVKKADEVFEEYDRLPRTSVSGFYQEVSEGNANMPPQKDIPQRLGYAVGDHRVEMLETLRGNKDPFDAMAKKQVDQFMGNFDTPILVPSATGERLVGCICEDDAVEVEYMLLYAGEKKKCTCGNWFQLYHIDDPAVGHH